MDQTARLNAMPQAPIFGVAGADGSGGSGPMNSSRYINIEDIFGDCFTDLGSDPLGPGAGAGGG
ncbi:unnamed protein product, partial [Laminaria digitata]